MDNFSAYFSCNAIFENRDADKSSVNQIMERVCSGGYVVLLRNLKLSINNCSTVLNISSICSSKLKRLIISQSNRKYLPLISTQHLIELKSFHFLTIKNIFDMDLDCINPLENTFEQYDIKFSPNKKNIELSTVFPNQLISTSITEEVCLYFVQEINSNTTVLTVGISAKGRLYCQLKDNATDLNIGYFIYKILCDWLSYRELSNSSDSHAQEIEFHSFIPHEDINVKEALESLYFKLHYDVDEITYLSSVTAKVNEENSSKYRILSDLISNNDNTSSEINVELFILAGQSNMSGRGELHNATQTNGKDGPSVVNEDCHKKTTRSFDIDNSCVMEDGNLREPMRDKVYFFDPVHGWSSSHPLLHYNVDILRKDKVGLGPGTPFAGHYYQILQQQQRPSETPTASPILDGNSCVTAAAPSLSLPTTTSNTQGTGMQSSPTVIGLIPVAVGATSIDEWQSHYLPPLPIPTTTTSTPTPSTYLYQEGCVNLMSCALRSIFLALTTIASQSSGSSSSKKALKLTMSSSSSDSLVRGILWFQGSRDATLPVHMTELYHIKLKTFMKTFRMMIHAIEILVNESTLPLLSSAQDDDDKTNLLSLPRSMGTDSSLSDQKDELEEVSEELATPAVVLVAITTTRPLESVAVIRGQQLRASGFIPNLAAVDSLGLELARDNIHLTSPGVVKLGYALAETMHSLLTPDSLLPTPAPMKLSDSTLVFLPSDTTKQLVPQRVRIEDILRVLDTAGASVSSKLTEAAEATDTEASTNGAKRGKFPLLQSGLKAVNFVSGDVNLIDFMNVLTRNVCGRSRDGLSHEDSVFCDLGSGSGMALAAALFTGYFKEVVGVELNRAKVTEADMLLRALTELLASGGHNELQGLPGASKVKSSCRVIEANFLDVSCSEFNWVTSAHVVYACATCFAPDQLQKLISLFRQLKSGTIVILLDRRVLDEDTQEEVAGEDASEDSNKDLPVKRPMFSLIANCQCNTTWGYGSVFVYRKMF